MSKSKFSLKFLNSIRDSFSDILKTSINVYNTFKIILKLTESVQLVWVFL